MPYAFSGEISFDLFIKIDFSQYNTKYFQNATREPPAKCF